MSSAFWSMRMKRASGPNANSPTVGMQCCPTSITTSALASAAGEALAESGLASENCPFIAPDSTTGICVFSAKRLSASQPLA